MMLEIIYRKIEELKPNDKNPRQISKADLNKLKRSIQEFGFVDPVIVNQHPDRLDVIVGGHQRVKAATELGMQSVPCVYINVSEAKENIFNIALNEISGDWDEVKLQALLKEINSTPGVDITLTGFDEPIIDEILSSTEQEQKEALIDEAPPVLAEPKTRPGEIYQLGRHRLMCGDSTKDEDMDRLTGGALMHMVWTDPPYGISYKGTNNPNGRPWEMMNADDFRGDELYQFLLPIYKNCIKHLIPKGALYSCYASSNHVIFEKALNVAGFRVKQQLIWAKGHTLGHSDYHYCHEPILYCVKEGENCEWFGDRTHKTLIENDLVADYAELSKEKLVEILTQIKLDSDVIRLRKDAAQHYSHPTQKPVALSRLMIKNSSRPGSNVLEPCCGSGATLMACETIGRTCYAMEIEPKYCDVIIKRWEDFTGQKAVRLEGEQ